MFPSNIVADSGLACGFDMIYLALQFVMEAWKVLEVKNVNLSENCYMLIIRALCNGGYLEEVCNSSYYEWFFTYQFYFLDINIR